MTSARTLLRKLARRRVQLTVLSSMSLVLMLAAAALTLQVFLELDEYGTAGSDNMQWTMAQLEADHVRLLSSANVLTHHGPESLDEFRRRFDAFYSRADTLCKGPVYAAALKGTDAEPTLDAILEMLDSMIPLVDGPNEALHAAMPALAAQLDSLTPSVKSVSALSVIIDANRSEAERALLTSKLIRLAILSLMMLATLFSLLALLWQLYRLYRRRALDNRVTLNRLSTILNTSQDAILVVAVDGRIIDSNTAAETAFGLHKSDGTTKTVQDILFRDEDGQMVPVCGDRLIGSCSKGPNRCSNLSARGADGRFFPVEMSADLANRAGNEVCVCFLRDISRRVEAQAEMEAARDKALAGERARARFLGMISHEMRTPLNGILGTLDLLDETALDREQERYSRIMHSAGQQLLTQINDALDLTQAGSGHLSLNIGAFDLDALLQEAANGQRPQAETNGTTLKVLSSGGPLGTVLGDRARVLQVLVNLLSNAVKFTRDGEVTIDAVRPDPDGAFVEVQVTDTGVGIPEEDLKRVFDDFVRLASDDHPEIPGTGLGLGIVRQLVGIMGGETGAESVEGEGSLFWVRLPLPAQTVTPAPARPASSEDDSASSQPLDILVVEDNGANRFVLTEMLRKDGHTTAEAADGETALRLAEERAFDLILMDIRMPGIGGVEAARRIRAGNGASRDSRIVFLTAHIRDGESERLCAAGGDATLAKPLRRSVLRNLLAGRLDESNSLAPTPVQGPVDTRVLDQLLETLSDSGLAGLLSRFQSEGDRFIADLPALRTGSRQAAAARVHSFAGSAATFGATDLQTKLTRIETALLDADTATASREMDDLPALWNKTRDALVLKSKAA